MLDRIGRNRFVTRYAYHHGHYDGESASFAASAWSTMGHEEIAALTTLPFLPAANRDAASWFRRC